MDKLADGNWILDSYGDDYEENYLLEYDTLQLR
jgi:hypothetical protein